MINIFKTIPFNKTSIFMFFPLILILSTCGNSIPQEINKLVFEDSQFAQPINIPLPCDESEGEKRVQEYSKKSSQSWLSVGLPPVFINRATNVTNPALLNYLVDQRLAEIHDYSFNTSIGKSEYKFLIYNETIKKFLVDPNADCNRNKWQMKFGKRILKTIDYTNEYEAQPMGVKLTFYAMTFKYEIVTELPNAIVKKPEYEGKAVAYLDPNDGKWKLQEIILSDNGSNEFSTTTNNFEN